MYYALIMISVAVFGICFAMNDVYKRLSGSGLGASMRFTLINSLAASIVLLPINNFSLRFTLFDLCIAFPAAIAGIGFIFCGLKALEKIDLSLYSLFSMLGGMLLPFFQGIFFYGEKLDIPKVICLVLICSALLVTVERKKEKKKGGYIYYLGIFILNGLSGVFSQLFVSGQWEKSSPTGYSLLISLLSALTAAAVLGIMKIRSRGKCLNKDTPKDTKAEKKMYFATDKGKGDIVSAVSGILNRGANLLLVIALVHVDASVQYPMVTGGVMIMSTAICFFGKAKPTKRELLAVALAFFGLLALL